MLWQEKGFRRNIDSFNLSSYKLGRLYCSESCFYLFESLHTISWADWWAKQDKLGISFLQSRNKNCVFWEVLGFSMNQPVNTLNQRYFDSIAYFMTFFNSMAELKTSLNSIQSPILTSWNEYQIYWKGSKNPKKSFLFFSKVHPDQLRERNEKQWYLE